MSDNDFTAVTVVMGILGASCIIIGATVMWGALGLLASGASLIVASGWMWMNHVMVEEYVEARKR